MRNEAKPHFVKPLKSDEISLNLLTEANVSSLGSFLTAERSQQAETDRGMSREQSSALFPALEAIGNNSAANPNSLQFGNEFSEVKSEPQLLPALTTFDSELADHKPTLVPYEQFHDKRIKVESSTLGAVTNMGAPLAEDVADVKPQVLKASGPILAKCKLNQNTLRKRRMPSLTTEQQAKPELPQSVEQTPNCFGSMNVKFMQAKKKTVRIPYVSSKIEKVVIGCQPSSNPSIPDDKLLRNSGDLPDTLFNSDPVNAVSQTKYSGASSSGVLANVSTEEPTTSLPTILGPKVRQSSSTLVQTQWFVPACKSWNGLMLPVSSKAVLLPTAFSIPYECCCPQEPKKTIPDDDGHTASHFLDLIDGLYGNLLTFLQCTLCGTVCCCQSLGIEHTKICRNNGDLIDQGFMEIITGEQLREQLLMRPEFGQSTRSPESDDSYYCPFCRSFPAKGHHITALCANKPSRKWFAAQCQMVPEATCPTCGQYLATNRAYVEHQLYCACSVKVQSESPSVDRIKQRPSDLLTENSVKTNNRKLSVLTVEKAVFQSRLFSSTVSCDKALSIKTRRDQLQSCPVFSCSTRRPMSIQCLTDHMDQIHPGEVHFKCDQCPERFLYPNEFNFHKSKPHSVNDQNSTKLDHEKIGRLWELRRCTFASCRLYFKDQSTMNIHRMTAHCTRVPNQHSINATNALRAEDRLVQKFPDNFIAEYSSNIWDKTCLSQPHKTRRMRLGLLTCEFCKCFNWFPDRSSLEAHQRLKHTQEVGLPVGFFSCQFCGKICENAETTRQHELLLHYRKLCKVTNQLLLNQLKVRFIRKVKRSRSKCILRTRLLQFICPAEHCGRLYLGLREIDSHLASDHGTMSSSYSCHFCQIRCINPTVLAIHHSIAHRVQPLVKTTNVKLAPKVQLRPHEKKAPQSKNATPTDGYVDASGHVRLLRFVCPLEAGAVNHEKATRTPRNLARLAKAGSDEVPRPKLSDLQHKAVNPCGLRFHSLTNLEKHAKVDHGRMRLYYCQRCGIGQLTASQLNKHRLDLHGLKNTDQWMTRKLVEKGQFYW